MLTHAINTLLTKAIERFTPVAHVQGIRFSCPNFTCLWRAETLVEKEPETIRWIDAMPPGAILCEWEPNSPPGTALATFLADQGFSLVSVNQSNLVAQSDFCQYFNAIWINQRRSGNLEDGAG